MIPNTSRRTFLADLGMGFTGLALGAMLFEDGIARTPSATTIIPAAKAKSVIWLFMLGGTSHLESFDPKPALNKYAGKTYSELPLGNVLRAPEVKGNFRSFAGEPKLETKLMPLQVGYRKRGQSGIEVSDWFPHVGGCSDEIAVVRSLWTTDFNHSAQLLFNTGRILLDPQEPSLGAWAHYGLGTLDQQLPKFVVLGRHPSDFGGGTASHEASYLGREHDGVSLEVDPGKELPFPEHGPDNERHLRQEGRELAARLNQFAAVQYPEDANLQARIKAYELAFHMQSSVPDIVDLNRETPFTQRMYGLDEPATRDFGRQCLVARRLVERGVRFVQIYHGGSADKDDGLWDAHNDLKANHTELCKQVDKPIAGLLRDLKQRGMLDSTLVVWATEFGRAPNVDLRTDDPKKIKEHGTGRDHHIYGFSAWLAGGGIKGGVVHGATDELGFHAVEHRHYVTDIHATVLHQLGLDGRRLEVPGRKRLDMDIGKPIREIIA